MTLTKSDFKKYEVNEVLGRREEKGGGLSAFSFWSLCGDERKRYEEAGDDSGAELFGLLNAVSSMGFWSSGWDPEKPFSPLWAGSNPGERSCMPEDFTESDLNFLAEIVRDVEESVMRARIADVLWLRKHGRQRGFDFAVLAHDSYLESVRLDSPDFHTADHLRRALQIARLLNKPERKESALGVAKRLADVLAATDAFFLWFRTVELLATHSEDQDERNEYAARIWQRVSEIEQKEGLDFAIRWMEQAIGLFKKIGEADRTKGAQLELAKILVKYAEREANNGDFWSAAHRIEQAISNLPQDNDMSKWREDLYVRLAEYGKKADENRQWERIKVELSQESRDLFEEISEDVKDDLKGKSLEEALVYLAEIPHPISADAMKAETERSLEESLAAKIAKFEERNHAGKVVRRDWLFSASWHAVLHRQGHVGVFVRPAIEQINKEHEVQFEDIQKSLERSHFVPPHLRWTFAYGLLAGLKFDFVAVAHVLPPMLEGAFRNMLALMRINTARWNDDLVARERPLGWILDHPEIREILGVDLLFDLRTLLLEPKEEGGFNLRNGALHGLMADGNFFATEGGENSRELAQVIYLWWIAFKLCFVIKRTDRTEQPAP